MAFIWNDESLAILRENAGILTTEQIAQLLHTNITAVRNMAYRLKLGNDSNLLIVFYVQIMPDDFVMQLHRF